MTADPIEQEEAACRAAWAAVPEATEAAHMHHGSQPFETLTEPVEARIAYIRKHKPESEQAIRLRCLRPVPAGTVAAYDKALASAWAAYDEATATALAAYNKATASPRATYDEAVATADAAYYEAIAPAHRAYCPTPDCPWDGKSIFGGSDDR